MADTDDEHTKEKIRYIKINYKKEIDARNHEREIKAKFRRSNKGIYKVYTHYVTGSIRIVLRTAAKPNRKVPYDNFFRVLKSHLNGLVDLHLIFECFENYRKKNRTWKVVSC